MIKSAFNNLAGLMLFFSLMLPTAVTQIKIAILFFITLTMPLLLISKRAKLSQQILTLAVAYAGFGLVWSFYGLIVGNPGAMAVLTVMCLYPIVFVIIGSAYHERDAELLRNLFINIGLSIGVFSLVYILGYVLMPGNYVQQIIEALYKDEAVVDFEGAYFKFTLPNISSCIFLLPFALMHFFYSKQSRLRSGLVTLTLVAILLLSGRRGFFVAVLGGLPVAYLLTYMPGKIRFSNIKPNINLILFVVLLMAGLTWFFTNFYGAEFYIAQITSIFDFEQNDSNIERANQFEFLMSGIEENPIFGSGAGAAAQYLRSIDQPWAYELTYVAFVFQYGIIGFLFYAAGITLLIYHLVSMVRKKGRNSFEFFYLSGFIAFMIANSTNPYLGKFDYMWVVFIPVAMLNNDLVLRSSFKNGM